MVEVRPLETYGHKFRRINNLIDKYMEMGKKKDGNCLSRAQCGILRFLAERQDQDVFQRDIEEAFHISRATASKMLKSMEKNEMIRREVVLEDARLKKLVLTDKAIEQDENAKRNIRRMEASITKGMSEEEKLQLRYLLGVVIENIMRLEPDCRSAEKECTEIETQNMDSLC